VKTAVVAIALLGFAAGLVFRLNVLIVILVFLLFLSAGYAIAQHFGILTSILTIIGVQVVAQGSYFLGLVARSIAGRGRT
jgi:hypothetical protein